MGRIVLLGRTPKPRSSRIAKTRIAKTWLIIPLVGSLPVLALGCGSDESRDASTSPASTSPATTSPATTSPATTMADTTLDSGCTADELENCVYPNLGSAYDERAGLSTLEPLSGRSLPLLARVPQVASPVPVVIWMHGGGFNDQGHRQSDMLGDMLARHGYMVIHVASAAMTQEGGLALCAVAQVPTAECVPTEDEDANGLLAVFRAYDLVAVLDDLPRLSTISVQNGGPVLDLERVAVGGWSGGSRAPMVVMGATVKPTPNSPLFTLPHSLPAAAFLMSSTGPPFGGLYDEGDTTSWDDMRGPIFIATGENDVKPLKTELTGLIRRFAFDAQPADGTRWLLYSNLEVGVGGHGTYNLEDLNSNDDRVRRLSIALASATRAFLDANLSGDAEAFAYLESNDTKVLAGDIDWLHR